MRLSALAAATLAATLLLCASTALAGQRFTDNGDGTVTDTSTGLMWAAQDNQGDINWTDGSRWVRFTFPDTVQAHYADWRMPTVEELQGLLSGDEWYNGYETACGQRVRIVHDIELTCGWVWAVGTKSITARLFNFQRGYSYTDRKTKYRGYRVLPVRNAD